MTTYYCDPGAGSNTSPYDTWAKAATDMQTVVDLADAGDIVYCRGAQTLTAAIDFDTNEGSVASGLIKYIGCNAAGDVDGTRFVLDGNSAAATCIDPAAKDFLWFENLELTNATGSGCDYYGSAAESHYWVNCYAHDNGARGWDLYYDNAAGLHFIRCKSHSNSASGWFYGYRGVAYHYCSAIGNTNDGFSCYGSSFNRLRGCVSHANGGVGVQCGGTGSNTWIENCVIDGNTGDGIDTDTSGSHLHVFGCRITNNGGYGIDADSLVVYGWNFFNNNTSGNTNGGLFVPMPAVASSTYDADTNETSGTEGYTDRANDDFNLTESATLRSTAIELP